MTTEGLFLHAETKRNNGSQAVSRTISCLILALAVLAASPTEGALLA